MDENTALVIIGIWFSLILCFILWLNTRKR